MAKHTIGSTFSTVLRGITATVSSLTEVAEGAEVLARTGKGMAIRNEKSVTINGNIALATRLKELAKEAKDAKLSAKDIKRLKDLGLDVD